VYDSSPFPIFFAFFGFFWVLIMLLSIASMIFWVWMLVDVVTRDFKKADDKPIWILIVALTGVVGSLVYYFMIRKTATKTPSKK
jgi:prolipoprotein diacylglyceryltransferase